MISRIRRVSLVAYAGDVGLLLMFSAIGRTTHQDNGALALLGVAGTAAPFLIGWTVAAFALGSVSTESLASTRLALTRLAVTWPIACAIGLGLRSLLEGRLVHTAFVFVALIFNFATLGAWRVLLTQWYGRRFGNRSVAFLSR